MKWPDTVHGLDVGGRPPRGGRGLKCIMPRAMIVWIGSPPSRGAWIEIEG